LAFLSGIDKELSVLLLGSLPPPHPPVAFAFRRIAPRLKTRTVGSPPSIHHWAQIFAPSLPTFLSEAPPFQIRPCGRGSSPFFRGFHAAARTFFCYGFPPPVAEPRPPYPLIHFPWPPCALFFPVPSFGVPARTPAPFPPGLILSVPD